MDELAAFGINLDNKLNLLAICDNGSEVYAVLDRQIEDDMYSYSSP